MWGTKKKTKKLKKNCHYAGKMAGPKPALYSAGVTCLGFASLALAATAVGLPIWGNFESLGGGWEADRGYFGPWKVCKVLSYGREICGREDFRFRPSGK